jgi:hypothetical protein
MECLFGNFFEVKSIEGIKLANNELEENLEAVTRLTKQEYPSQVQILGNSINTLINAKEGYESRTRYTDSDSISAIMLRTYRIDFLWTQIDGYAKKHGLELNMQPRQGTIPGAHNLDFTLNGGYIGITNFIYDIENDENLNFRIENFVLIPEGAVETEASTNAADTSNLRATFTVAEIGVSFN